MSEAEKYIKQNYHYLQDVVYEDDNGNDIEMSEVLQSFADHYLKKKLEGFDDVKISEMFPLVHSGLEDVFKNVLTKMSREEGAKAILRELGEL